MKSSISIESTIRCISGVLIGLIAILSNPGWAAAVSCTVGTGASLIGTEYAGTTCAQEGYSDSTPYYYACNTITCVNNTVTIDNVTYGNQCFDPGYQYTPQYMEYIGGLYTMRIFRNEKGTHFLLVSRWFTGTIDGRSVTSCPWGGPACSDLVASPVFPPSGLIDPCCWSNDPCCGNGSNPCCATKDPNCGTPTQCMSGGNGDDSGGTGGN
jgi:hypothetical protein